MQEKVCFRECKLYRPCRESTDRLIRDPVKLHMDSIRQDLRPLAGEHLLSRKETKCIDFPRTQKSVSLLRKQVGSQLVGEGVVLPPGGQTGICLLQDPFGKFWIDFGAIPFQTSPGIFFLPLPQRSVHVFQAYFQRP